MLDEGSIQAMQELSILLQIDQSQITYQVTHQIMEIKLVRSLNLMGKMLKSLGIQILALIGRTSMLRLVRLLIRP